MQIKDDFNLEGALAAMEAKASTDAPTFVPKPVGSAPALTPREPSSALSNKPRKKSKASGGGNKFQMLFWEQEPSAQFSTADDAHAEALLAKYVSCA